MALTPTLSTAPARLLAEPEAWRRVLVFAPHPDDESLAAGGLLQQALARGAEVRVVFCTDGEDNAWAQRAVEHRWRIDAAARARWGARRRAEAHAALACLGLPPASATFLDLPDQGLTRLLLARDDHTVARLAAEIAAARPTLLVAPSVRDRHPDHSAVGVLVRLAVAQLPPAMRWFTELAYVVHGPAPASPALSLSLTGRELARKRGAILCHASQLALSRRRFLAHARIVERFAAPGPIRARHPVQGVAQRAGLLIVTLAPRALQGLQAGRLHVIGQTADGDTFVTSVRVRARQRQVRIRPTADLVRVFVKRDARRLFLDATGWRELWLVPTRPPLPASRPPSDAAPQGSATAGDAC